MKASVFCWPQVVVIRKGTADLAYLPETKMLVVPRMLDNKATALDVSK